MRKSCLAVCVTLLGIPFVFCLMELAAIAYESSLPDTKPWMVRLSDDNIRKLYNLKKGQEVQSYRDLLNEIWITPRPVSYSPFIEYKEAAFSGKYLSVSPLGYRLGESQSPWRTNKPKIFVFGGSTSFGYGVKNNETIASYLQKKLLVEYKLDFAVYNFGASAYDSSIERVLFEKLLSEGEKPTIAIFIDGLNDMYFHDIPGKTVLSDELQFNYEHLLRASGESVLAKSALYRQVKSWFPRVIRHSEIDGDHEEDIRKKVIGAADRLTVNRQILFAASCSMGVLPIFVHQPVPVYNYDRNKAVTPDQFVSLGNHLQTQIGYEYIAEKKRRAEIFDKNMLWLQDLQIPENQYVDTVHYSPAFNNAIAGQIAKMVLKKFPRKICDR